MLLWQNDNIKIRNTKLPVAMAKKQATAVAPRLVRGQLPGWDVCGGRAASPGAEARGSKRTARPRISVAASFAGDEVPLAGSQHAGLGLQGSPRLISAAPKGEMVKWGVLLN